MTADPETAQPQDLLVMGYVQISQIELHLAMQLHYIGGVGAAERVSDSRGQTVGSRPAYSLRKCGIWPQMSLQSGIIKIENIAAGTSTGLEVPVFSYTGDLLVSPD